MNNSSGVNVDTTPAELLRKLSEGREYRNVSMSVRAQDPDGGGCVVEGYATTFNMVYRLYDGSYYKVDEQIDSQAFAECDMSDVIFQFDHMGRVFARTGNDTLKLTTDDHGLRCWVDLSGTEAGRQLYEEIKGGYVTKMSFGFVVGEDRREETEDHDTGVITVLRTITRIKKLFDVSAVSLPANDTTEISARSYCDGVIAALTEEHRKTEQNRKKTETLKLLLEVTK